MLTGTRFTYFLRRAFFWALVVAFFVVVVQRFPEILELLGALSRGRWTWIMLAAVLQVAFYVSFGALFQAAFYLIDVETRLRDLIPITFATLFVNATTPSAGTAGWALFIEDIRRRGGSTARATAGTLLAGSIYYGVYTITLVIALILLLIARDLTPLEITSATLMFLLTGIMVGVLGLAMWRPRLMHRLFSGIQRLANRVGRLFRQPDVLGPDWAERMAGDFAAAANAITTYPARVRRTVLVAVLMHLLNILSLGALFLAFDQPLQPHVLITGYAMTFLFIIISPTPSGVGVVETIMPLVYRSLGLSVEAGAVLVLAYRGLSLWIPLLIGFVLLQRLRMFSGPERALAEVGNVRVAAILTALMGLINVLSAFNPALTARVEAFTQYAPLQVRHGSNITAALAGFALLLLAHGLWRHKRAAWAITLAVLSISAVGYLLEGRGTIQSVLTGLLALFLIAQRSHFHALSDRPSVRQGLLVLLTAMAFTLTYGAMGFFFLSRIHGESFSLEVAILQTLGIFESSAPEPLTSLTGYFVNSIYVVGAGTLGYALILLLRPVLLRRPASVGQRQRAAVIIGRHGQTALARFALLPDKAYFFSPGGSVIPYSLRRRSATALGDPIGPSRDLASAIAGFWEHCRRLDWNITFYQAGPDLLPAYEAAGLQAVPIGYNVWMNLSGSGSRETAEVGELEHLGYRVDHVEPPLSPALLDLLRVISDEWLSTTREREKAFAQARFDWEIVRDHHALVVTNNRGYASAFLTFSPDYPPHGVAVNLLRYRRQAQQGLITFLLVRLADWAWSQGYLALDLGFQPQLPEPDGDETAFRLSAALMDAHEPERLTWQLQGLPTEAFQDRLVREPRYLVFASGAGLSVAWRTLIQLRHDNRLTLRQLWNTLGGLRRLLRLLRRRRATNRQPEDET